VSAVILPEEPPRHLVGLEGLRFLCALAILLWHYSHFGYVGSQQALITTDQQPLYGPLKWLYEHGALSVQVFWSISGFVFAWKYGDAIRTGEMPAGRFFWLRFSRLYPLHFVTLLLVAGLQLSYFRSHGEYFVYPENGLKEFVLHLFFASNWFHSSSADDYSFNGPVWSVSVEVLIYGLFFVIAMRWGNSLRIAAALTLAAGAVFVSDLGKNAVVLCIHYYFLGVVTERVYAWAHSSPQAAQRRIAVWVAGAATLCAVLLLHIKVTQALSLVTPFMILLAVEVFAHVRGRFSEWTKAAGELTYSIYLIHFPLQLLIVLLFGALGLSIPWRHPAFLLGFVGLSIGFGMLSYAFLEKPARRVLRGRVRPANGFVK